MLEINLGKAVGTRLHNISFQCRHRRMCDVKNEKLMQIYHPITFFCCCKRIWFSFSMTKLLEKSNITTFVALIQTDGVFATDLEPARIFSSESEFWRAGQEA